MPELSEGAVAFVVGLARNAYSENARPIRSDSDSNSDVEDCLTSEALKSILSVLSPEEDHPWTAPPAFKTRLRVNAEIDNNTNNASNEEIRQSILLPGLPHSNANLSFDRWLLHWQLLALSDPVLTQILLFKLGYAERGNGDYGIIPSAGVVVDVIPKFARRRSQFAVFYRRVIATLIGGKSRQNASFKAQTELHPKQVVRVCILGDNSVGKSSFVWHVSGLTPPGSLSSSRNNILERGAEYEKPIETIVIGGCAQTASAIQPAANTAAAVVEHLTSPSYLLSLSAIPLEHVKKWSTKSLSSCDIAILMFQCGDANSLQLAYELEEMLPTKLPRIFLGSKVDFFVSPKSNVNVSLLNSSKMHVDKLEMHEKVLQDVTLHLMENDLPNVILTSTQDEGIAITDALQLIHNVLQAPLTAIPLKHRPRPLKFYQQPSTAIAISAAIGVASVAAMFLVSSSSYKEVKEWFEAWLKKTSRSWFGLVGSTRWTGER